MLRIVLGAESEGSQESVLDSVDHIEATLDDMNPELFGHLFECLFNAGALEVFLCPIQAKKTRPGVVLSVLESPGLPRQPVGHTRLFELSNIVR